MLKCHIAKFEERPKQQGRNRGKISNIRPIEVGFSRPHTTATTMENCKELSIETVEMHTGGEPLRIIIAGYPNIEGKTILDKRRYIKQNLDHLRKFLMFEPRGHFDQYGALLVEADVPEADLAVIFMHNEGYSTMCGHAVIALGRFAVDYGYVKVPKGRELQRRRNGYRALILHSESIVSRTIAIPKQAVSC